jgi:NAD(P)-dependent dehydrogenase (short-subunit alcohol dehydrogenase family)
MPERFRGKTALLTGGTGALGRIVSQVFHDEGAAVVMTYIHEDQAASLPDGLRSNTTRVLLIRTDVTDEAQVKSAFQTAVATFGTVDYLLNLVGGYMGKNPIEQVQLADWEYMMNLNLKSVFLCSREALKIMLKTGNGRIINISAMAGVNPSAGRGAYGVSKAGVATLTRIMAEEVRGSGITVNALAPSIIVTEANVRSSPGDDYSKWVKPEEIAEIILFLCSDAARSINGAVIEVKGVFR